MREHAADAAGLAVAAILAICVGFAVGAGLVLVGARALGVL